MSAEVWVRDGRIAEPGTSGATRLDTGGLHVAPGSIDLQVNGAVGADLTEDPATVWEVGAALPRWGVTAFLPTLVSPDDATVARAIDVLRTGPPVGWWGAVPLGLHVEGPFISPVQRGTHPAGRLRAPTVPPWADAPEVRLVTLAPELDGALDLTARLPAVVSVGHTGATAAVARAAFDRGARMVTHLFNAMTGLHHREPGVVGAALGDDRVVAGLIVDGVHVHPDVVALAWRLLGPDRTALVTDTIGATGLPAGEHRVAGVPVTVADGAARNAEGALAGSVLTMDQAVRNVVAWTGCSLEDAVTAAAATPARVLGETTRGTLDIGARADLVLLDDDLAVVRTVVGGRTGS